jgi:hypothetical protein
LAADMNWTGPDDSNLRQKIVKEDKEMSAIDWNVLGF